MLSIRSPHDSWSSTSSAWLFPSGYSDTQSAERDGDGRSDVASFQFNGSNGEEFVFVKERERERERGRTYLRWARFDESSASQKWTSSFLEVLKPNNVARVHSTLASSRRAFRCHPLAINAFTRSDLTLLRTMMSGWNCLWCFFSDR